MLRLAFIAQNVLSLGTAIVLTIYSQRVRRELRSLAEVRRDPVAGDAEGTLLLDPSIPGTLGIWGGGANALGHVVFAALLIAV